MTIDEASEAPIAALGSGARDPKTPQPTFARTALAVALTFGVMLLADALASYAVVAAAFAAGVGGLFAIPIIAVLTCSAIAAMSKATVGRAHVWAAISVTSVQTVAGAYGLLSGILIPLNTEGADLFLHVAVCALSALSFGLFLGPLLWRAIGVAALIGLVALLASIPTTAERQSEQMESADAAQREANFEHYLREGVHPLATDLPGWDVARAESPGDQATAWLVSADGAVVETYTQHIYEASWTESFPCLFLAPMNSTFDPTQQSAELPDWCVRTAAGWQRPDGDAVVVRDGDRLIMVRAAADHDVSFADGDAPAGAADVSAVMAALRPMTVDEIREHIADVWLRSSR